MQKLLDLFNCTKDELGAQLKEFRIKLGLDPIDFCSAVNYRDSAMLTMIEEGVQPIEYLLIDDECLPSLITLIQENSQFLKGASTIEERFDSLDRLLEQQRETGKQMDTLFVQLALESIKSSDKAVLQRLIGIASSIGSEYLPFLMAAYQEG